MLRPDYAEADARQTVRLVVVTSPLPDGNPAVGQLWADVARHYANDHRDFIVKAAKSAATEPADLCSEGIEGVLHIIPLEVKKTDDSVSERLRASLSRCRDGTVVWSAESAGKWASADPNLKDVAEHYATALGADVTPYVAPAYHILKPTLEALPKPVLDDKAKDEKIDMSE
jgi:probable lipoprotein (TIGR04455 family)